MQNAIYLSAAYTMTYFFLISISYLVYIQHVSLFCLCAKLLKKLCFFLHAHVSTVSRIVLFRYCVQSFLKIFSDEVADMGAMKSC